MIFKSNEKILIKIYNLKKIIKIPMKYEKKIYLDKNTNSILFEKNQLKKN
jgi:hypothetical protein